MASEDDNDRLARAGYTGLDPEAGLGPQNPQNSDATDWAPLIPLDALDLPPFPTCALPARWGEYVDAVALSTQTPPDLAALTLLGVWATACQGKFELRVREDWAEPLCLWVVTALPPANRKSAVFKRLMEPVYAYERDLVGRARAEHEQAHRQKDSLDASVKAARKRQAAGHEGAEEELERLLAQQATLAPPEPMPVLLTSDVTPEALGLLLEQHGRITVASAEGNEVFAVPKGRYSRVSNYDLLLKAHSGDAHTVHRVNRAPLYMGRALATLVLAVQPSVLKGLDGGERERGLLGRLLYAVPPSPVGTRQVDPPSVPDGLAAWYAQGVRAMLDLDGRRGPDGDWVSRSVQLAPDARDHLMVWATEVEHRLGEDGDLSHIADWAGKLVGATCRIAGLLHAASVPGRDPARHPVTRDSVAQAIVIARYLIAHGLTALSMIGAEGADREASRRVIGWIRRNGAPTFSQREVHSSLRRSMSMDDIAGTLLQLAHRGYVRQLMEPRASKPGRPRSPRWEAHPDVVSR